LKRVKKHRLQGERWEVERERDGVLVWKVEVGVDRERLKARYERGRRENGYGLWD